MFSDSYGDIKFDIRRQPWYSIYMMNSDIETSKDRNVTVTFLLTELNAARARETRLAETLPFWFTEALAGLGFVVIVVSLLFVTALFSA